MTYSTCCLGISYQSVFKAVTSLASGAVADWFWHLFSKRDVDRLEEIWPKATGIPWFDK